MSKAITPVGHRPQRLAPVPCTSSGVRRFNEEAAAQALLTGAEGEELFDEGVVTKEAGMSLSTSDGQLKPNRSQRYKFSGVHRIR